MACSVATDLSLRVMAGAGLVFRRASSSGCRSGVQTAGKITHGGRGVRAGQATSSEGKGGGGAVTPRRPQHIIIHVERFRLI